MARDTDSSFQPKSFFACFPCDPHTRFVPSKAMNCEQRTAYLQINGQTQTGAGPPCSHSGHFRNFTFCCPFSSTLPYCPPPPITTQNTCTEHMYWRFQTSTRQRTTPCPHWALNAVQPPNCPQKATDIWVNNSSHCCEVRTTSIHLFPSWHNSS